MANLLGTIEMNKPAKSPASDLLVISFAKKYEEIAVKEAKTGAKNTQMFLISTGIEIISKTLWIV